MPFTNRFCIATPAEKTKTDSLEKVFIFNASRTCMDSRHRRITDLGGFYCNSNSRSSKFCEGQSRVVFGGKDQNKSSY